MNNKLYNQRNSLVTKGEITGEKLNSDIFDHGMPIRSQYNLKEQYLPEQERNDFDLFNLEEKIENMKNVQYYDEPDKQFFDINEIENNNIFMAKDPISYYNKSVLDFSVFMTDNISHFNNSSFIFSPFSIVNLLSIIFVASKTSSLTYSKLKKYFNFSDDKKELLNVIYTLKNKFSSLDILKIDDIIFINNNYEINKKFINYISNVTNLSILNTQKIEENLNQVNSYIINKYSKNFLLSPKYFYNLETSLINLSEIYIIWLHKPESRVLHPSKKTFLLFKNILCNISEDSQNILLEFNVYNNLIFGIIYSKHNQEEDFEINPKDLEVLQNNVKLFNIKEILIPEFEIHTKMKLKNLFKKTGLENLFTNLNIFELTKENSKLDNIYINNRIKVTYEYEDNKNLTNKSNGNYERKIILNKQFYFYVKSEITNTIIFSGKY